MTAHHDGRTAPGSFYLHRPHPLSREQWDALTREQRVQWYEDTNFDRSPPSGELMAAIMVYLIARGYA